jgi:ubiquinone/menaquinone biosynthesis C-methylase UbiE
MISRIEPDRVTGESLARNEQEDPMTEQARTFLPAAGKDWLLPFYDPIVKLLGGDAARKTLVEQADLRAGQRVLEVGCGTGTLVLMIKREHKNAEVVGIDPDPKALKRARDKAARSGLSVQFDQGFGDQLPYPDESFDRVLSSFMFHHLPAAEKDKFLAQVRRVLKRGGSFHLLDFEETGKHGWFAHLLHAHHRLEDNTRERVIALVKGAGLEGVGKVADGKRPFGRIAYYRAVRG